MQKCVEALFTFVPPEVYKRILSYFHSEKISVVPILPVVLLW